MLRVVLWTVAAALVLFPAVYFALNWSDVSFRAGAIGNWFGTVVGVIVGVPIGIELARAQQESQAEKDRQREITIRNERKRSIEHRLYDELQHDSTLVAKAAEVLSKSRSARLDVWQWAEQIVNAMEFEAYCELDIMLLPQERTTYRELTIAYRDLKRLVNRIREAPVMHNFLSGQSGDQQGQDLVLADTKDRVTAVQSELAAALKQLRRRVENA